MIEFDLKKHFTSEFDFNKTFTSNQGKKVLTKKEKEIMMIALVKDTCEPCPHSKAKITNRLRKKLFEKQNK